MARQFRIPLHNLKTNKFSLNQIVKLELRQRCENEKRSHNFSSRLRKLENPKTVRLRMIFIFYT